MRFWNKFWNHRLTQRSWFDLLARTKKKCVQNLRKPHKIESLVARIVTDFAENNSLISKQFSWCVTLTLYTLLKIMILFELMPSPR